MKLLLLFIFIPGFANSQIDSIYQDKILIATDSLQKIIISDSTSVTPEDSLFSQKVRDKMDSLNYEVQMQLITDRVARSGLDTIVTYKASDSIVYNLKSQKMRLRGDAEIKYKTQQLNAEVIEMSFQNSEMTSFGSIDSNGKLIGYPKFNDKGEDYFGENIRFNFQSGQGVIAVGETQISDGFYFGTKIKRMSESEMFIEGGYYTTCDHPEPHFHFGSSKMKIIADDRVLLDPLVLYIEDLPVFIMPFGLFFPTQSGRKSGLIIPSFFFSQSRGVVFQNLGFYWAASDYWDTQIKTDLYTKGGYMLKNQTRWALRNQFNGNLELEYGKTRFNVDDEWTTNWRLKLNHNQDFTPNDKAVVNLDFTSSDFNRNTSSTMPNFIQQNIRSAASYTKNFENRTTLSVNFDRDQNIVTDGFNQNAAARFNLPTSRFFSQIKSLPRWVRDISFSYSSSGIYQSNKTPETTILPIDNDPLDLDTINKFRYDTRYRIEHRPSVSINPKFGYFTVSPFVNFSMNNYFRRVDRRWNDADSSIIEDESNGFYYEYNYGMGINVQTKLYGVTDDTKPLFWLLKPSSLGIKAARHVYNPNIAFVLNPDQSAPEHGFYGTYYDTRSNREVLYSRFELDGGGIASRAFSSSIRYSDIHSFEIKLPQKDTLPDVNVEILRLNLSTGYDFARDSLNLSDLNIGFRSPSLKILDFNGNANFKFYDEDVITTTDAQGNIREQYVTVNRMLAGSGKGLMRLTNLSLNFSTTFSSKGIDLGSRHQTIQDDTTQTEEEKVEFGKRFQARHDGATSISDLYGDSSPGYSSMNVPWNVNLGLVYSYSRPSMNPATKRESINLRFSGNLRLTETWSINTNGGYDFVSHTFNVPQINFIKDLHCWELVFNWTPVGGNSGFYLKLGIRASQLKDLRYELQDNPLMR
ncbi:MAG: LPS-assembly protein LptD [Candidatus Kapabacteria bacterium]|nr:LPS-assembly protein LptD [Ignavibacteriota bacterium]MCW5885886.1 LPS-assembly protein LptD [Candidatus Kapabacteria bacterium]